MKLLITLSLYVGYMKLYYYLSFIGLMDMSSLKYTRLSWSQVLDISTNVSGTTMTRAMLSHIGKNR